MKKMPEVCPLCLSKGKRTPLKFLQMNLSEATKMCIDMKCPYPLGLQYADTFIKMDFMEVIADESIKLDVKNFPHIGSGPQNVDSILVSKSEPDNYKFHSSELPTSDQASLNENKLNETDIMDFKLDDFITSNVNLSDFDINAVIENFLQNGIDEMLLDNNKEELVIENNNKTKDFDTLLESNKNSIVRTTGNVSSEGHLNVAMRETKENLSHSVLEPCCSEFVDDSTENSETNPKDSIQDEILTRNCERQIFPAFLNHTEIFNSYDVAINTLESPMTDNKSAIMLKEKVSGDNEHTSKSEASALSENIPVEAGRVTKYVEPTKEGTLDLKHNDSFEKSPQIVNNIQVTDSSGSLENNDEFLIHKTFFTTDKVKEISNVSNTYCLPREMLEHSYYKMVDEIPPKDLNTNTDSSDITGNRDVMVLGIDDIEGTSNSSFVTNSESVECLSIENSDMYIAENVAVASCGTNSKVEVITGVKERISILKDNDSKTEFHCKTDTEVRDDTFIENAIVDNKKLPINILKVSSNPMTVIPEKLKAESVCDHISSELTITGDDIHTSKSRESAFVSEGILEKVALVEKTGRAQVQNSAYDRKNDDIMINSKKAFSGEVCLSDTPSVKVSSSSRVVKIGEKSNMIVVKCKECLHTPKCDNLGKDVSVVYIQQNDLPQATALESNTKSNGLSRKLQSVSVQNQQLTHSQPLSLEVTLDSISSVPKKLCVTQPVPLESSITYCGSSASQQKKANKKKIAPLEHNTGTTLTEQLGGLPSGDQTQQKQNEPSLVVSKSTNEMVSRNVQQRKLTTRKLNLGKDKSLKVMFELRKNFDTERFAGFTFESASKKTPPGPKPSRIIEGTNSKERKRKKEKSVVSRPSRNNLTPNIFHIHSDNQEHTNVENCIDEYIVNTNVSSLCVRTESNANSTQDWIEELLK